MKLNKISGRSYKDLTQYPVFPWVMNDGSQLGKYRDLSKSMGALGNDERREVFLSRFDMVDPFNKVPQFYFGSHYSSPAIIFHFLIRLRPFSDGARELQSGKFDLADRLFFSIIDTYRNAIEELSDVRELIPEFYYMPEMFINYAKYDFGLQQTGVRVNNVELPQWAEGNPYKYVSAHRLELESEIVSSTINGWIDLIFGYKQKGKEAEKCLNTFYYLTYENGIDLENVESEKQRISYESQMVHFGQTPSQIFDRPHQKRDAAQKPQFNILDEQAQIKFFRQKVSEKFAQFMYQPQDSSVQQSSNFDRKRTIIRINFVSDNKLYIARRNGEIHFVRLEQYAGDSQSVSIYDIFWERDLKLQLEKSEEETQFLMTQNDDLIPFQFIKSFKFACVGGMWDGRLIVYNLENQKIQDTFYDHNTTIVKIQTDQKGWVLVTGDKIGIVSIYQICSTRILKLLTQYNDHDCQIEDICICNDLQMIGTCGQDGWIHCYNLQNGRYLRSYQHPKSLSITKVCFFTTPLYGVVFYCNQRRILYSYSINGQFLSKLQLSHNLSHLQVGKDSNLNDILIVILQNEKKIVQLTTPFLNLRQEVKLTNFGQNITEITTLGISNDRRILTFGTNYGEFCMGMDLRSLKQE